MRPEASGLVAMYGEIQHTEAHRNGIRNTEDRRWNEVPFIFVENLLSAVAMMDIKVHN